MILPNMLNRFPVLLPLLAALAFAGVHSSVGADGKRLYRWVDEQGNVHYSDQVPADQSRPAKSILNERGMTVDQIEAAKTAEQLAEEKRLRQLEEERRREQQEQAARDRVLLNTFHSEADIIHARDSKITALENLIHISQNSLKHLDHQQRTLVKRAAAAERSGKPVPKEVADEIQQVRRQIGEANQYIEQKRKEQAEIRRQYEQDILRYRTIKAEMSPP